MRIPLLTVLWGIVSWFVVGVVLALPLWVLGWFVCSYCLLTNKVQVRVSQKYEARVITAWRPGWAWVWGNEEDGIWGDYKWRTRFAATPRLGALLWCCWRNPSNNFRFVPGLTIDIEPHRIGFIGNHDYPSERRELNNQPPRGDIKWAFTWHGWYTGFVWRMQLAAQRHFQIRLGWKLLPKDRFGVSDYRAAGCGFGAQIHWIRKEG